MKDDYDESLPEWVEVLQRGPIRIMDETSVEGLVDEMAERLEALLRSYNGLEPTAEGWRQLALELALKYDPAFKIETPVDRESIGGRPVGMSGFILRSRMKSEMRKGKSQAEAARSIAKQSKGKIAAKTATNSLSRKAEAPDFMRRAPYEWKADSAMRAAARKLSQ
jgi:hypothetical protein